MKKITCTAVTLCILVSLLSVCALAYTPMTVETQFDYSVSNPAWLKSLVLNENMLSTDNITVNTRLTALPEYPYSKTADSFKSDVEYYVSLYSLDVSAKRAAYVYVLDYMNSASAAVAGETSDEYIKEWLEGNGIVYPPNGLNNPENLIFARTLYSLMSRGYPGVTVPPGTTVQAALVMYMSVVFGDDMTQMLAMNDGIMPETLDEYVYLVCLVGLNANGYSVSRSTPVEEVYRLSAVQTVRTAGIAVDADTVTFDELRNDFTAVWVGKQYGVSLDPAAFAAANAGGTGALYVIKMIGKSNGIAVKDGLSYKDAFETVAANTTYFAFDTGEFYADIYNYEAYLTYIREKVWICPTALRTPGAGETLTITIDGAESPTGEYKEVRLSADAEIQTVMITVTFSGEQNYSKTYTIRIHQGAAAAPPNENSLTGNSLIGTFAGNTIGYVASAFPIFGDALSASLLMPSIGESAPKNFYLNSAISSAFYLASAAGTGADAISPLEGNPGTLLVIAAAPPEGYEYVTDEKGYVISIVRKKDEGTTGDGGRTDVPVNRNGAGVSFSYDMIKTKLPYAAVPAGAAVLLLVCAALFKKKD